MKKNKVLVDLEGTLSNPAHRMHLCGVVNAEFQKQFRNDKLNEDISQFMSQLKSEGYEIIILTAKLIKYNGLVLKWLDENSVDYDWLILKEDLQESDVDFKEQYVKEFKEDIAFALDDVGKNCAMFAKNGIPALRITQK